MGSDFPYFQDDKYTRAVTHIDDLAAHGVDAATIEAVRHGNAERLYADVLPAAQDA